MGWNQLSGTGSKHEVFGEAALGDWFYFVHSYHAVPSDAELVLATVDYGPNKVTACVGKDNVLATQFHPEKSQAAGLALLKEHGTDPCHRSVGRLCRTADERAVR